MSTIHEHDFTAGSNFKKSMSSRCAALPVRPLASLWRSVLSDTDIKARFFVTLPEGHSSISSSPILFFDLSMTQHQMEPASSCRHGALVYLRLKPLQSPVCVCHKSHDISYNWMPALKKLPSVNSIMWHESNTLCMYLKAHLPIKSSSCLDLRPLKCPEAGFNEWHCLTKPSCTLLLKKA